MSHLQEDDSKSCQDAKEPEAYVEHPAWQRLEDQLSWYDNKSVRYQNYYKRFHVLQVIVALLIPLISFSDLTYTKWLTASAGALIAILEAVQQINRYSELWVTYRATAERLKRDKYLFLSAAGPFKNLEESDRLLLLAERVEEDILTEHTDWIDETKRVAKAR